MIKVVCAWCGDHIRDVICTNEGVSHGICSVCKAVQMEELNQYKENRRNENSTIEKSAAGRAA